MLAFWIQFAKTMHFLGLISWMAGIFYMPRLLVYLREAQAQAEPTKTILSQHLAQYAERLYKIIMQPAMIITFIAGTSMIFLYGYDWFAANLWLHFKFVPLLAMAWFHLACFKVLQDLKADKCQLTSTQLRLFNEIPTVLLLAIVMLAVFKNSLNLLYAFLVLVVFSALLILAVRLYKKMRSAK
jgi:putative membrane protein